MIAENTVPSPEMVGMITSVLVKTAPEREDSETRTVGFFLEIHVYLTSMLLYMYLNYHFWPLEGSSVPLSKTIMSI